MREDLPTYRDSTLEAMEQVSRHESVTVTGDSKALFIACSRLPTLVWRRGCVGIPIWSYITATAWAANPTMAGSAG